MKILTIQRNIMRPNDDQGQFGTVTMSGNPVFLKSVELPNRKNSSNESCVLPRVYEAMFNPDSTKGPKSWNGAAYELQSVPGRSGILIHSANWAGDKSKGWISQLEGCIALGMHMELMTPQPPQFPENAKPQFGVVASVSAVELFMTWAGKEPIQVIILAPK